MKLDKTATLPLLIGLFIIIVFLVAIVFGPTIGDRLGLFGQKKEEQTSLASEKTVTSNPVISSAATCKIVKPTPTRVTGLEGVGIKEVIRLKPGGIFTIQVTGVRRSDKAPAPGANIPSYYLSTYHWRAL